MDEMESEIKDDGKKEPDYTSDELCVLFDQVKKNYATLYGRSNKSQYKAVKDRAWADLVQKVNNCHE